jgi:hypothetical protein
VSNGTVSRRRVLRASGFGVTGIIGTIDVPVVRLLPRKIVVDGSTTRGPATYEIHVTGVIGAMSAPGGDFTDGNVARGRVSSWKDSYRFLGEVVGFGYTGSLRTFLDGHAVDPDSLAPNTLTLRGNVGGRVEYMVSVAGAIRKSTKLGASVSDEDTVSGSTATGFVHGGTDSYTYTSELVAVETDAGRTTVYRNGRQIDPDSLAALPNTLTIRANGGGRTDYTVAVTGSLERSTAHGATIDADDMVSGNVASGHVADGVDSYAYSGTIRSIETDPAGVTVRRNGTEIDPRRFPAEASPAPTESR